MCVTGRLLAAAVALHRNAVKFNALIIDVVLCDCCSMLLWPLITKNLLFSKKASLLCYTFIHRTLSLLDAERVQNVYLTTISLVSSNHQHPTFVLLSGGHFSVFVKH